MFFLAFLLVGLVSGFIVDRTTDGPGLGFFGDIVLGIIGSMGGGYLSSQILGEAYEFGGAVIFAALGSLLLLAIGQLFGHGSHHTNMRA